MCNSLKVINKSSELKRYRLVLFVQTIFVIIVIFKTLFKCFKILSYMSYHFLIVILSPFSILLLVKDASEKVKWKMQFILCFLKSASKSLNSQSCFWLFQKVWNLNFPLLSCYCHRNIIGFVLVLCYCYRNFISFVLVQCYCGRNFIGFVMVGLLLWPKTYLTCYCFDFVIENGGCWFVVVYWWEKRQKVAVLGH